MNPQLQITLIFKNNIVPRLEPQEFLMWQFIQRACAFEKYVSNIIVKKII